MAKSSPRAKLIEHLNEDLSREYQAIIAYVVYSQALKGAQYMNIADELELHAAQELQHALKIAKHIDYLGGMPTATALAGEALREGHRHAAVRSRATRTTPSATTASGSRSARSSASTASPRTSARSCVRSRSTSSIWRPRWARTCPTSRSRSRSRELVRASAGRSGGFTPDHLDLAARWLRACASPPTRAPRSAGRRPESAVGLSRTATRRSRPSRALRDCADSAHRDRPGARGRGHRRPSGARSAASGDACDPAPSGKQCWTTAVRITS